MTTQQLLIRAVKEKSSLAMLSEAEKNRALNSMADAIIDSEDQILKENMKDVEAAKGSISEVMIDRLSLNHDRIEAMARGIRAVAKLPDPVGRVISSHELENKLTVSKVSVPIGVVAIIYESRPNVTSDAVALCIKSGNVCVLRGGKEAFNSSAQIVSAMKKGLESAGFSPDYINFVTDTSRGSATELMTAVGLVDLLIPRGGKGLIKACTENAKVPCIETGTGICHIYIDEGADIEKAVSILENAKTQRPSVCNACEVCLVNKNIARAFLPKMKKVLVEERENKQLKPIELRLDAEAAAIIDGKSAAPDDFDMEFLDYTLAVKVVDNVKEAVSHIARHSTHHSDAIITESCENAEYFTRAVDSAAVYVNASTRFTDGEQFGLGCEMGISTQKLHARGPMGLAELNTYKYVIIGDGQIRK